MNNIHWLGHASFKLTGEKIIYIDPYEISETEKADIILITHTHHDHLSMDDIEKIRKLDTVIFAPEDAKSKLSDFKSVKPYQFFNVGKIKIETVPAYNLDKEFHPEEKNWVGYVIEINGERIYHAGDTDLIPEMSELKDIDVALLPIGGTYTMDVTEALQAVNIIAPKIAIPMHYGKLSGTRMDAEKFKQLASCKVELLQNE